MIEVQSISFDDQGMVLTGRVIPAPRAKTTREDVFDFLEIDHIG
jgi:hypothetical protein